jgi:hypothetical protein
MTRRARIGLVVASVVLALVALLVPEQDAELVDATTYGTMPWGYRATHDLLVELGFPVVRHHEPLDDLPARATAWWLAPRGACANADEAAAEPAWYPAKWVESGGTAVVFLPDTRNATGICDVDGYGTPPRIPADRDSKATVTAVGPPRTLHIPKLRTFAEPADWVTRATYADRPLVLEQPVGDGRLVVVADARLVQNLTLAEADTAPFVVDLVRAFGVPRIVEDPIAQPGKRTSTAMSYLATSSAAFMLAGVLATGLLIAWRGTLIPPRTIDAGGAAAATLQTFVDSLARLYAGTHDHQRVLTRYRELTAARLRRHLRLPVHTSLEAIAERLGRGRPLAQDARALLLDRAPVATPAELRAAVGRLDALAAEVIG